MKRNILLGFVLCLSLGIAAVGCKKKDEAKKEAKGKKEAVEKKAPEEKAETPAPVATPDPPEEVPEPAAEPVEPPPVEEKKPDPAAEVKPEPETKPDTVAHPVVKEGEAPPAEEVVPPPAEEVVAPPAEPAEEPAPEEGSEPSPPEATDVVSGEVVEPELPEGQFGREFKLEAVMMLNDVVKHPAHYAEFESVKLRGEVLAIKGNDVLLGLRTSGGFFGFMARVEDPSLEKMFKGQWVILEGKIVAEGWSPDGLGAIKMAEGEELTANYEHLLAVEAGKLE